ncbi:MAG TPA: hypothetical protein VLC46_01690 [Thermoanaerobaculia bacterium]|jgi:protein tyrosine phosphatase (PTP) superfamily phosphohydrolase (DUF442 family)|nr:hypothetical protein [Thermoanaerobaculia bacterium]
MALLSVTRTCALAAVLLVALSLCGCCSGVSRERIAVSCADSPGPLIPKFCIATPNVLWAGGRPDRNDVTWLMQQGIRTIVDLEIFHDDRSALAQATVSDSRTHQLRYYHVRDWEPLPMIAPSLEDDRVARVLAIISEAPAPVFVHCRCGMKRADLMVAAHRVVIEGVSAESAIRDLSRYGGAWSGPDTRYILALSQRRDEMRRRIAELAPKLKADAFVTCTDGQCSVSDHDIGNDH